MEYEREDKEQNSATFTKTATCTNPISIKNKKEELTDQYRSNPIQVDSQTFVNSIRATNSSSSITMVTDGGTKAAGEGGSGGAIVVNSSNEAETTKKTGKTKTKMKEKFKSGPIDDNDDNEKLRNSLRMSVASKRSLMTGEEVEFLEEMLEKETTGQSELESMREVLDSESIFYGANKKKGNDDESRGEAEEEQTTGYMGSQKRLMCLETRKKEEEEKAKKRTVELWKRGQLPDQQTDDEDEEENEEEEEDEDPEETAAAAAAPSSLPPTDEEHHVMTRRASANTYGGMGFEIEDIDFNAFISDSDDDDDDDQEKNEGDGNDEEKEEDDNNDKSENEEDDDDEVGDLTMKRRSSPQRISQISASDSRSMQYKRASTNMYNGKGYEVAKDGMFDSVYDEDGNRKSDEEYDPWLFQDFDRTGQRREFRIFGTAHNDHDCHPHVMSPDQMECFQPFLPDRKKGESFWLKYSLVRDGASMITYLKKVRSSQCTLLAIETIEGEVFGAFVSTPWTINDQYYGSGESFLWRRKHLRSSNNNEGESLIDQIKKESEIEVFPWRTFDGNEYYQMCNENMIAVGGGVASVPTDFGEDRGGIYYENEIGFGLYLGVDGYLLEGTSSPSLTYHNPPLAQLHSEGSRFEVLNMEVWGFTPCVTEDEARVLEYKNMFFRQNAKYSNSTGNMPY